MSSDEDGVSAANEEETYQNENECHNCSTINVALPNTRKPLNTIPDPSQLEPQTSGNTPNLPDVFRHPNPNLNSTTLTPTPSSLKTASRTTTATTTPNSRTTHFVSNTKSSSKHFSSTRVSRGIGTIPLPKFDFSLQVPHFDLHEDPSFWADHNVQVLIRIRPLNPAEKLSQGYGRCLRQETAHALTWLGHPQTRFTFDHVACETISQEELFRVAGIPMVENCMSGYNSCMFAYGQTGSGKTYTMMGELASLEGKLSEDCGITPRIFDYLFSRIRMEEESRRDEKLRFSCKCSFLEIYNEQITDLLEPSSTNLQLREDLHKGVYVENLKEYNVRTVNDVIKLLLQGSANRKMAATHMNSESSRSHSVFTCIIESWWERDSMTHFRFARLNLVDLAGSERQKSSGAEGDRLKEAANINKSLSTLGLVIMSLVDLAHGKHRHVPYRDSRLTFLLQDSLGGNSKTTIMANVSPSICSAHETLSTLKFAQRAKLIQNNAKVNEDASGDVDALQRQIQQLKDQLSFLMEHHDLSKSLSQNVLNFGESRLSDCSEIYNSSGQRRATDTYYALSVENKKMKHMEATLVGALRREKMTETIVRKLEAEIEHVNQFACQCKEDVQLTKMMLKSQEEKIKQLELLVDGSLPADHFLMEENKALKGEIQLLQARIDRQPELTSLALENARLLEQLQLFQNFYEQGERETLLAEVSEIRDQLLETPERKHKFSPTYQNLDNGSVKELEDCRNMNAKLMRQVDDLCGELRSYLDCEQAAFENVDAVSAGSDLGDEMVSYTKEDDMAIPIKNNKNMSGTSVFQSSNTEKELMDAKLSIEAKESEQADLIEKLELVQDHNHLYAEMSNKKEEEDQIVLKLGSDCIELQNLERQNKNLLKDVNEDRKSKLLKAKLEKLTKDLEDARLLNCQYQIDQASKLSQQSQVELVCEQVEMETAKTILHLQDEVSMLQLEFKDRIHSVTQENLRLRNALSAKEDEMRKLCGEWERATLELTSFLVEGSRSLKEASGQIESIVYSFPQVNVWISEHVEKAARVCIDKEETILRLEKSLEDAQKMVVGMELKLNSLKEVTMTLSESQSDSDRSSEQAMQLNSLLIEKINIINMLENKLKFKDACVNEAEKRADAAFLVIKWLSDHHKDGHKNNIERDIDVLSPTEVGCNKISSMKAGADAPTAEEIRNQVELKSLVLEAESSIDASYRDVQVHIESLRNESLEVSTAYMELVQDLVKEIQEMRSKFMELKENHKGSQSCKIKMLALQQSEFLTFENQCLILHSVKDELTNMNERLQVIEDSIKSKKHAYCWPMTDKCLVEANDQDVDDSVSGCSTSSYSLSGSDDLDAKKTQVMLDLKSEKGSMVKFDLQNSKMLLESNEAAMLCLRKELDMVYDAFNKLFVHLTKILNGNGFGDCSYHEELKEMVPSLELRMKIDKACQHSPKKVVGGDDEVNHASIFLGKCEEVHATMKEADYLLNALLKANENAKQLNGMWKQASEELKAEKSFLIEENEQLKSSICLQEEENKLMADEIRDDLVEVLNSISWLEGCLRKMQQEVEESYKVLYSDVLSMGREMLYFIRASRSSLETICSEIMEKGFALSVVYQCLVEEVIHQIPSFNAKPGFCPLKQRECHSLVNTLQRVCFSGEGDSMVTDKKRIEEGDQSELVKNFKEMTYDNLSLRKELERKEVLLKGLLFDFSLLQETASNKKDIKDETEKLVFTLNGVRRDLEMKTSQFDDLLVQHKKVEGLLVDTENALYTSTANFDQAKKVIDTLSDQNAELRMLLKDMYFSKSEAEDHLEEQREIIKGLEKEIIVLTSSTERNLCSSVEGLEEELRKVTDERDKLCEEICSLNEKLEMAHALADENEAIAIEARQESEASKAYLEQKEEEVKILEHSIEELECTINVLEKKVCEMDEEVERHRLIRDTLELELQALRQRLSTVKSFTNIVDSENKNSVLDEDPLSRQLHSSLMELRESHNQIRLLEKNLLEKDKEIKQFQEYISELVLHSEAQASQYIEKYKTLETMVHQVKTNSSNYASVAPLQDRSEKTSMKTRGSSSPFRCIAGLVQQMNLEKDQELSAARLRIEELESGLTSRHKEVCVLNARLAAAESMTHDVIRDLLGVKLDMTSYANLIDHCQVQALVEKAQQQTEEFLEKDQEIQNLKKQINDLVEEKESCRSEMNKKVEDILAAQMTVEQLRERDLLLSAQNEMLKMDKTKLLRRVAELDEMVKTLLGGQGSQQLSQQMPLNKENVVSKSSGDLMKRVAYSKKFPSHVNGELARYHKSSGSHSHVKTYGCGSEFRPS